jgi:hypothetical protein
MTKLEKLKATMDAAEAARDAAWAAYDAAEAEVDDAVEDYCAELEKIHGDKWRMHI